MGQGEHNPEFNVTLLISQHSEPRCTEMRWPHYPKFLPYDEVWDAVVDALTGLERRRRLTLSRYPLGDRLEFANGAPLDEAEVYAVAIGERLGFTTMRKVQENGALDVVRLTQPDN